MINDKTIPKTRVLAEPESAHNLIVEQALVYAHDLKQALRSEREKQAALDRLRLTFLGTIKHEMQTPLVLILQLIEILEDPRLGSLSEQHLDAVTALGRQVQTMRGMVDGLTRAAAFICKQEPIRPVLARLEPILDNVLPLAEFKARSKEIVIEADLAPNLPRIHLDVKQIEEALTQLLDNAIKFNQSGGQIKITTQVDDVWLIITVSDTGVGIKPEQMDLIWELFEQDSDPLRRAQEGLGLGLALAHYIIEAHGGLIDVDTTVGQGSTFTVKLPRVMTPNGTSQ